MNGVELFNAIKKQEGLKDIPFILVTSHAEKDKVESAIKEGIRNYILKPYELDILKQQINALLK